MYESSKFKSTCKAPSSSARKLPLKRRMSRGREKEPGHDVLVMDKYDQSRLLIEVFSGRAIQTGKQAEVERLTRRALAERKRVPEFHLRKEWRRHDVGPCMPAGVP